jgi:hypothetical protein
MSLIISAFPWLPMQRMGKEVKEVKGGGKEIRKWEKEYRRKKRRKL